MHENKPRKACVSTTRESDFIHAIPCNGPDMWTKSNNIMRKRVTNVTVTTLSSAQCPHSDSPDSRDS